MCDQTIRNGIYVLLVILLIWVVMKSKSESATNKAIASLNPNEKFYGIGGPLMDQRINHDLATNVSNRIMPPVSFADKETLYGSQNWDPKEDQYMDIMGL